MSIQNLKKFEPLRFFSLTPPRKKCLLYFLCERWYNSGEVFAKGAARVLHYLSSLLDRSYWWQEFKSFFRRGDLVLLALCLMLSAFGILFQYSVNSYRSAGPMRYVIIQTGATVLGVLVYAAVSAIDLEFLSEHRAMLTVFSVGMLLLLVPFGVDYSSGNTSWIELPLLPFAIQPAEVIKISYILVTASVMNSHQNRISSIPSVLHVAAHLVLLVGLNLLLSRDWGVSLIFVFIFLVMTFTGGVRLIWFAVGAGATVLGFPLLWSRLGTRQQNRILVLFDESIDPQGLNERYQLNHALKSLTGGGLTGQGLFNGNRTQVGALPSQHTDFVFSAIGEELGYVGCALVALMLLLIVARVVWVGVHSKDYMRRLVCFGSAAALAFQVLVNIGMNIGLVPIIGLTLPLVSYGGSSVVSIYAMLGLVSGVHARPAPRTHERYIQPPR